MKTVVVTGATSFIGINLIRELLKGDYLIYSVIRPSSQKADLLPISEKIHIIEANISDYLKLDQIITKTCNIFIHLAWNGTRGSSRMNASLQEQNFQYSKKALDAALRLGCSTMISAGSQAEYGVYNSPISEDTLCHPNTEYGKWKLRFCEEAFSFCSKNGVHFKEPRFFSLYGADDFQDAIINSTLRKMLKNEDCELTECKQMWDFLYISDAVEGVKLLMEQNCTDGVYNFGNGLAKPLREYIEEMARLSNSKSNLLFGSVSYPVTGMVSLEPLISKLIKETQWHPRVTFEQGILHIIENMKSGDK